MKQIAAAALSIVRDAGGDDALHLERRLLWIAAGGKRREARPEEPDLREPSLKLREHDVRRDEAAVAAL